MSTKRQTAGQTAATVNPTMASMRLSLIAARKLNNKKAISRDFVSGNPQVKDPDKVYEAWCKAIGDIYRTIQPWAESFNDVNAEDTSLQAVYQAVIPMWVALTTDVDPKMFARSNDVHRILGFSLKYGQTTKGSVDVATSMTTFRQYIETMMGIRIAQGAVLTEEEADLVKRYDKTVKNIDKLQARLDGTTNSKGEHREGLTENLETAKAKLAEMREFAIKLGVKENEVDDCDILAAYVDEVANLEAQITKTKKSITEAQAYLKDNKKAYDTVMKKVNEITA